LVKAHLSLIASLRTLAAWPVVAARSKVSPRCAKPHFQDGRAAAAMTARPRPDPLTGRQGLSGELLAVFTHLPFHHPAT